MFSYEVEVLNQSKKHLNAFPCKDYRKFRVATAKHSRRIKELEHKGLPSGTVHCHCLLTVVNYV